MRRAGLGLVLVLVATFGLVSLSRAQPIRYVALEPAAGTLENVFTVTGTGFLPGEAAVHTFVAPDGSIELGRENGAPALHFADETGMFQFQFVPQRDFASPVPGPWKLNVCLTDWRTCATLEFTLSG